MSYCKSNLLEAKETFASKETFRDSSSGLDSGSVREKTAEGNFYETGGHHKFCVKILKKEHLEDYFSQTKNKKHKRKPGFLKNLSPIYGDVERSSQKPKKQESVDEKFEREKCLRRYYELDKKIQYDERMNYIQQRRAEEEYILEQEQLAETWMRFINSRRPPEEATNKVKNRNSRQKGFRTEGRRPGMNVMPKSEKCRGEFSLGKTVQNVDKSKEDNQNLGDLSEGFNEKLVFVDRNNYVELDVAVHHATSEE